MANSPTAAERAQQLEDELLANLQRPLQVLVDAANLATQYLATPNVNAESLQIHITYVKERVTALELAHRSANRRIGDEDHFLLPEQHEQALQVVREMMLRKVELVQAAKAAKPTARPNEAPENVQVLVRKPALPPMPIPRFSGNIMEYHNFMAVFDQTIHNDPSLSSGQKLVYLQGYMEGEAKRLLGDILVTDENYEMARISLQLNYGQSEQMITNLYQRLVDLPKARNDPISVRDTYNATESIFQTLEKAGVDVNAEKFLYIKYLEKLPWALVDRLMDPQELPMHLFRDKLKNEVTRQIKLTKLTSYVPPPQSRRRFGDVPPKHEPSSHSSQQNSSYGSSSQQNSSHSSSSYQHSSQNPSSQQSSRGHSSLSSQSGGNQQQQSTGQRRQRRNEQRQAEANPNGFQTAVCPFDQEDHYAEECKKYPTAAQREAQLNGRCNKCFRLLEEGHTCWRPRKCKWCPSWEHNRALCPIKFPEVDAQFHFTQLQSRYKPGAFVTVLSSVQNPTTKQTTQLRILLDLASDRTAISQEAAARIGIRPAKYDARAVGTGNKPVEPVSKTVFEIDVLTDHGYVRAPFRMMQRIADDVRVNDIRKFRKKYPQFDSLKIPNDGKGQPVDMIIGTDILVQFLWLHESKFVHSHCQLMGTKFGYVIIDSSICTSDDSEPEPLVMFAQTKDAVELMLDLDVVGLASMSDTETELEEKALEKFYETLEFKEGRYEIRWPWKHYPPNLNENYGLAVGRLKSLHKKLKNNVELLREYDSIIAEQIREGIVEEVPVDKIKTDGVVHYIPHHAVIVLDKNTQIRIVYDASAALASSKSLNQNILKGAKWLGNMVGSLLRFRKHGIAVSADIRKAFHQIAIAEEDRNAVRFIWLRDPLKPPTPNNLRILRFKRVAFGIVASPFLLYATVQHHLRSHPGEISSILQNEMYADNLIASLPSNINPIEFYKKTKELFGSMAMQMTKWKSNSHQLMAAIDPQDAIQEQEISVLGLRWNTQTDRWHLKQPNIEELVAMPQTKRTALKIAASVFDPLGWAAPLTLKAKLFLRDLWLKGYSWDKQLDETELAEWKQICIDLHAVNQIDHRRMFFRWQFNDPKTEYEMHVFVDASQVALGAVAYLRAVRENTADVAFLMARTRLAPSKKLSIPRLELCAMVLGCRLQKFLQNEIKFNEIAVKTYVWSDSKCVLAWVPSNKLLPAVVERRLVEIRATGCDQFRYVPSKQNPADAASRGTSMAELQAAQWSTGPNWLRNREHWPGRGGSCEEEDTFEIKDNANMLFIQNDIDSSIVAPFSMNIEEFSKFYILIRKTTFRVAALNFICLKLFGRELIAAKKPLDSRLAINLWVRWDQRRNGADNQHKMAQMSHLKQLELLRDEEGLVRCQTRLRKADPPFNTAPILLVKGSKLTELIVLDIHERNFHVGTAQTLATLRQSYWLTHGRREVYSIIHKKCLHCRRTFAEPYQQPVWAPLPSFRITKSSRPFQYTGIDIFGPVYVHPTEQNPTEKAKRWVLLLTCLTVRAIHLEVITAMETIDIICALKRFVSRRGTPEFIMSDNAKQFALLDGTLKELWGNFIQDEQSIRYFAETQITWKFIPEYAPWAGGVYERMVGTTKSALRRTYGEHVLFDREFQTTIIEIEGVINNRPITYVDREPGTVLLTPNHFLRVQYPAIPVNLSEIERRGLTPTKYEVIKYWKAAEKYLDSCWKYWSTQYVSELRNSQQEKKKAKRIPKVGEVVLMVDPSQRRGYWRTARIEKLIKSSEDGKIRAAQIRLGSGRKFIRPITRLASLELLEEVPAEAEELSRLADAASSRGEGAETDSADGEPAVVQFSNS